MARKHRVRKVRVQCKPRSQNRPILRPVKFSPIVKTTAKAVTDMVAITGTLAYHVIQKEFKNFKVKNK